MEYNINILTPSHNTLFIKINKNIYTLKHETLECCSILKTFIYL